jgi:hypothetical protein
MIGARTARGEVPAHTGDGQEVFTGHDVGGDAAAGTHCAAGVE